MTEPVRTEGVPAGISPEPPSWPAPVTAATPAATAPVTLPSSVSTCASIGDCITEPAPPSASRALLPEVGADAVADGGCTSRQLISGSCTNASSIASTCGGGVWSEQAQASARTRAAGGAPSPSRGA